MRLPYLHCTTTGPPENNPLTRQSFDQPVAYSHLAPSLVELASGVDALYLSGRTVLPIRLLEGLAQARQMAEAVSARVPFELGDECFTLAPTSFGRYRYCLEHPDGRIGVSPSTRLPPIRVQPRRAYLHTVGPTAAAARFENVVTAACGPVHMSVSRIDLYADFEGWNLAAHDRDRFSCRSASSVERLSRAATEQRCADALRLFRTYVAWITDPRHILSRDRSIITATWLLDSRLQGVASC